ncbi:MAG: amino acid adenylation domain-containing protein, partial [Candidatus Binatia bacterium]
MLDHFQILLQGIVADPGQRLSDLPMSSGDEKDRLLVEWNDTKKAYSEVSVDELFEAQVERCPEAVAVMDDVQQLTYGELNQRANRLAQRLRRWGVGREVLVAIYMERSVDVLVALLGVLKAGGAYVPLDPNYPVEWLAGVLDDIQAPVLLSKRDLVRNLPRSGAQLLCLDSEILTEEGGQKPVVEATLDDLAYVIFTSGSTGRPKGVEVTHRALANFALCAAATFDLQPADRVLQFAPLSFDTAVEEIFPCLIRGATLMLRTDAMVDSVLSFLQKCDESKISVLDLPTAYWHELAEQLAAQQLALPGRLRLVIIGGERAVPERWVQWRGTVGREVRLLNTYGPTETTVVATMSDLTASAQADGITREVPIGRPICNVRSYVLDRHLNPVPIGVPGELHVGGVGLARGYLHCPDLSAEKFIPDPFGDESGGRLYKTGDLVRYLPDGQMEFLGRLDQQVKIRGFRIELGEIEAALRQHDAVRETVVLAGEDAPGSKQLVAYAALESGHSLDATEARSFLKQKLPEHMVPSAFVFLDSLPLTQNGKLDRNALLATRPTLPNTEEAFIAARDELELQLTQVWERILRTRPIGLKDNFFDLGGHSLLAVRLISQVEKLTGRRLSLASLFQAPTIEEQAKFVRSEGWSSPWSSLVAIQPGGSKPPLFCVHAHDGNVLFWRELSRRLGPEQPFYGLQAQGFDGKQAPDTRVEDMASRYVREIQLLQPEGPYFLGGHCFGGLIAFEMAQQLHAQGQTVALLALMDSFVPLGRSVPRGRLPLRYRIKRSLELIRLHIDNLMLLGWG